MADNLIANHRERTKKPYFTTVCPVDQEVEAIRLREELMARGIPSFPTFAAPTPTASS